MRKLALVVGLPVAGVFVGGGLYVWWERGAPPGFAIPVKDEAWEDVESSDRGVRVHGTAHYPIRLRQRQWDETSRVWYAFPFMRRGDYDSREIRIIMRTPVPPDPILGYEDRTVNGLVRRPGNLVTDDVRAALEAKGYTFAPEFVVLDEFTDD